MFDRTFRVKVPGAWQDAWLYKDALLLWARNNACYKVPIKVFQQTLEKESGDALGPLFELALFRNEWKTGEQYKRMIGVPEIFSVVSHLLLSSFGDSDASLTVELPLQELQMEPVPGTILDTEVYGNRVFIASTLGAFETRYIPGSEDGWQETVSLTDVRTSAVCAKYSCLNVSAGDVGLLFKTIRFGPLEDERVLKQDKPLDRVADASDHTAFASRNLLNYWGGRAPTLLRSRGEKIVPHDRARFETFAIDGYSRSEAIDALAWRAFASPKSNIVDMDLLVGVEESQIEILGNSGHRLLVAAGGAVGVLDIRWKDGKETRVSRSSMYGSKRFSVDRDEVLSTHQLGTDFLIERFDSIDLVTPDGVTSISEGQASTIRTFSESRRFREVAVVVSEGALEVIGRL